MSRAGELAVRVLGAHRPPVVLLHGLVGSAMCWGSAYDRLAAGHLLIIPDLSGFGHVDNVRIPCLVGHVRGWATVSSRGW